MAGGTAAADRLAERLAAVVGPRHVLEDADVKAPYERDWTGRWGAAARLVVRPGDAEEVAAVVAACTAAGAAIVPQGGITGLVGGGVPRGGEVVLSLRRLDAVEAVDVDAGAVVAGAGATLADVQAAARAAGWDVGVDLAARATATVGGLVATNAGGIRVLRYGAVRSQLLGVGAVLADGSGVGRVPGLAKDNSGYHWPSLLAGSEGTLGVVVRAHLRLVPLLPHRAVALVGLRSMAEAVARCGLLRRAVPSLTAVEVLTDAGVDLVVRHGGVARPWSNPTGAYLLVEVAAHEDPVDELVRALADVADAAVASDPAGVRALWALRERHTEAIAAEAAVRGGPVVKLDVTVPLPAMARFSAAVGAAAAEAAPDVAPVLFGHLADGNLHVNLLPPDGGWPHGGAERAEAAVLDLVLRLDGSVSSEHGIGVAKLPWLVRQRGEADVRAMRAVKAALDPRGVLNPGVLLPST